MCKVVKNRNTVRRHHTTPLKITVDDDLLPVCSSFHPETSFEIELYERASPW